jgi:hypothetical protein
MSGFQTLTPPGFDGDYHARSLLTACSGNYRYLVEKLL